MGKHHDQEYKEYVAKLIVDEDRKAADVAQELALPYSTTLRWAAEYKKKKKVEQSGGILVPPSELEKLEKLKKEQKRLREENEILKKAMHIFTKNQQ